MLQSEVNYLHISIDTYISNQHDSTVVLLSRFLALISTVVPRIFNEKGFVQITHRSSGVNYLHISIHFFSIGIATETESLRMTQVTLLCDLLLAGMCACN